MKYMITVILTFIMNACTLSLNNIDTHGTSSDLVDETQENQPDVSPNVNIAK